MPIFNAADGTRLAYAEVGDGPPVLCLPGGPGRAAGYFEDLAGLSQGHTLVLLDFRGTGRSELPADPSSLRFARLADDVEALRGHLGVDRADVLGHSAGSVVAQVWAGRHPDRVGRLALVTPVAVLQRGSRADVPRIRAERSAEPWYAEARQAELALADASAGERQALVRATRPFMYGSWNARTQAHAATADRQSRPLAERAFGDPGVDLDGFVAALAGVRAPVLVVGGGRDGVTGVEAVHEVAASFPAARTVVLPGAGHFPWVDEPAAFRAAVEPFFA